MYSSVKFNNVGKLKSKKEKDWKKITPRSEKVALWKIWLKMWRRPSVDLSTLQTENGPCA
jgi:hypothetical protein